MHPPLKIIDQTDELIAIEWLRENGYNTYAEYMEADSEQMPPTTMLINRNCSRSIFARYSSSAYARSTVIRLKSVSHSHTRSRSYSFSRIYDRPYSVSFTRSQETSHSTQSSRASHAGSNSVSFALHQVRRYYLVTVDEPDAM